MGRQAGLLARYSSAGSGRSLRLAGWLRDIVLALKKGLPAIAAARQLCAACAKL